MGQQHRGMHMPLPDAIAAQERARVAMTDAAHGLEAAMAQVQQLIADTQWSSRGLRALQERLAEVHREIARSHSALQGAPRGPYA